MFDLKDIVSEMDQQIKRLTTARDALVGLNGRGNHRGKHRLSASARKRISEAQKQRWARVHRIKKAA
jgi:hypothetical protein